VGDLSAAMQWRQVAAQDTNSLEKAIPPMMKGALCLPPFQVLRPMAAARLRSKKNLDQEAN
jgi:hypothetical protein